MYYLDERRGEVYFTTSVPDADWRDDSWSSMGDLDELRASFEGFHPHVRQVLAACPHTHKWAIADRAPLARWHDGPVVLLGDACHPMTPYMAQGAAQALEDAMILARCLDAHDLLACWDRSALGDAYARYQCTRQARASEIQALSHGNQWMREKTDSDWLYRYDATGAELLATV